MTYALVDSGVDISTLTAVEAKKLKLKEALDELLAGNIVVLSNFEQTAGVDTFVKLNLVAPKFVTEITYNIKEPVWKKYPVAINAFSLYDTYAYDEATYGNLALRVGDTIKYRNSEGIIVAGLITGVYVDSEKVQYFTLNGEDKPYMLIKVPEAHESDSNIAGSVTAIAPVADSNRDSHQVSVRDWQTKVWVLL